MQQLARWYLIAKGVWHREEHQNVLECRAVVTVLRRLSRNSAVRNCRVLVITDSLVTIGALAKGRYSSPPLLAQARVAAAISLALGLRLYLRWVPSQGNHADGPCRGASGMTTRDTHAVHGID